MIVTVEIDGKLGLEQMRAFLEECDEVLFEGQNREEVYIWVSQMLCQQEYTGLLRSSKGLVRRYMEKMTGLSRAQITRLITQCREGGDGEGQAIPATPVSAAVHAADIELLANLMRRTIYSADQRQDRSCNADIPPSLREVYTKWTGGGIPCTL